MLPKMTRLHIPNIIELARTLPLNGKLANSNNNLTYLDIDDDYIHRLFPLLQMEQVKKPNYFGEDSAGAHITVIYPEEKIMIHKTDLGKKHHFLIKDLVTAEIGAKIYYVLLVESPSLLQIRRKYELPDLLNFKGYSIGFHITIGVN